MNYSVIPRTILNEQSGAVKRNILNPPLTGFVVNVIYIGDEPMKKEFINRKWYHFEKGIPLPVDRFFAEILCRKRTLRSTKLYRLGTQADIQKLIESGKKIRHLIIRERGLGDLIMLGPVLTKLSKLFPWWEIHVACEGPFMYVVEHVAGVAKVWSLTSMKHEVRAFPLQTSLSEYSEQHPKRKSLHRTNIYATKFHLKMEKSECKPQLLLSDDEIENGRDFMEECGINFSRPVVAIELRSSRTERHWPWTRTKKLVELLLIDCSVIILDGKKTNLKMEHPFLTNLAGKTSVATVTKVIANCDVLLAWDSGLLHIAGALDIQTLAMMGAINHELRTSYYNTVRVMTKKGTVNRSGVCGRKAECYQCTKKSADRTSACIDFTPESVEKTLRSLLKKSLRLLTEERVNGTKGIVNRVPECIERGGVSRDMLEVARTGGGRFRDNGNGNKVSATPQEWPKRRQDVGHSGEVSKALESKSSSGENGNSRRQSTSAERISVHGE